jgi:hypothetical protein
MKMKYRPRRSGCEWGVGPGELIAREAVESCRPCGGISARQLIDCLAAGPSSPTVEAVDDFAQFS